MLSIGNVMMMMMLLMMINMKAVRLRIVSMLCVCIVCNGMTEYYIEEVRRDSLNHP